MCTKYLLSCINKNSQKFFKVAKYACNAHFISSPKGMQVLTDRESNKNWNDFLWLYFVVSKNAQIFSIFVQIQLLNSLIREPFNNNLSSMRICLCIFFLLLLFFILTNVAIFYRVVALQVEMQMIIIEADRNAIKRFRLCTRYHFVQYTAYIRPRECVAT